MKLSAIITEYRRKMNISQREFARACDLSNSYISFLENEVNPRTGRPIVPTIDQYRTLASGMQISVHELFKLMDEDSPVNIAVPDDSLDEEERRLIFLYRNANDQARSDVFDLLEKHQKEV